MRAAQQLKDRRITTLVSIAMLCTGTGALAGCGGSSTSNVSTHQARPTAAQSSPDVGNATAQITSKKQGSGSSRRTQPQGLALIGAKSSGPTEAQRVQRARSTPATTSDEHSSTGGSQLNPCTLVSASEAQAITGGPVVGPVEAPLGPTCIYRPNGSKAQITLAVESMSFSKVTHQMTKPNRVTVRGHLAYCGRLGAPMLFIPLSGGRVLNVTAPCGMAQRFAATALGRLSA